MIISEKPDYDIFVGSKIGSFKHAKYHTTEKTKNTKKYIENLVDIKSLQKDEGITCLEWADEEQNEILVGKKNQQIQIYNTTQGFTKSYTADFGTGDVVGLGRCKRKLVAATGSGVVKVWSKKEEAIVNTGASLDRMRLCPGTTLFGTGGDENDLKLYDISATTAIFAAKSLPHDWLQLRQPVRVSDLVFLTQHEVAVCSRYGYVRLYDSRVQRRPVSNVQFQNMAASCISAGFDERQVFVGFARGQLHLVDLRRNKPDKGYKGAGGAITAVATLGRGAVASTSLDRHLRVHAVQSKELIYKQYLTSKLTAVLVQNLSSTPLQHPPEEPQVKSEAEEDIKEEVEDEDDLDNLFDNMETVGEKRKKVKEESEAKRAKPSAEGSTDSEAAIAQLLRSTERQKRKMEKKKRDRKAKSVFHNA